MAKDNNFEIAIESLIKNDSSSAIKAIEKEIEAASLKGHHKVVNRLKHLVSTIPRESSMGGASAAGGVFKSQHKVIDLSTIDNDLYERLEPKFSLSEVVLPMKTKQVLKTFLDEWEHRETLMSHGIYPSNKLLMYGPPGTGKTKLAHAIAHQLDMPLVLVRLDELISSYLGRTGKNIRQIFELAENESIVLFLDEIDTIAKNRADSQDLGELKRVVTVLLQNIDMLSPKSIVIGATNHENLLDKAIWRRFPQKLQFNLPDEPSRRNMIKLFMDHRIEGVDLEQIVGLTKGLTGSTIKDFCDSLIKASIIHNSSIDNTYALKALLEVLGREIVVDKKTRKNYFYKIVKELYTKGYNLREIETISGIPYTTLREHVS